MKVPDWRLGQLLINAVNPIEPCPELFALEDPQLENLVAQLSEWLDQNTQSGEAQ